MPAWTNDKNRRRRCRQGSGAPNLSGPVLPDGEAWAVGAYTTSSSSNRALIERYVPSG
jgi:hypothetical protein